MPTSMDYSKYRYENYEGRPNVWVGYHLGTPATRIQMNALVLEVARKLFLKAPRNTYVFTGPRSDTSEVAHMYRVTIERNDEVLGYIAASHGRNGNSVLVDNEKVRLGRIRGGALNTSDAKRAAALALKKFVPTTNEETLVKSYGLLNEQMRRMVAIAVNLKRDRLGTNAQRLLDYIEKNWEGRGQAILHEIGVPPSDIAPMTDAIVDLRRYASLRARFARGITFVIQKGNTLYAVPMDLTKGGTPDAEQRAFHYEDAPGPMRQALGVLKVAEEGVYIEDFGMRLGESSFGIFYDLTDADRVAEEGSDGEEEDEEDD